MATPQASNKPEVQSHYAAQTGISLALAATLRKLWALIDHRDLKATLPEYVTAVTAVVQQYGSASASIAADHFETMRADAGITSPFRTPIVDPPTAPHVEAVVSWATDDLWTPQGATEAPADDLETAVQSKVEGAATKLVADTGRNEIIAAIEADKEARGWARVARPGACAFCLMLATRGAVYMDEHTAGREANAKFKGDGEFKFHNNCHCTIEPLFGRHYEAPAHIRAARALYEKSTKGESDKLNAFRRAVEAQRRTP